MPIKGLTTQREPSFPRIGVLRKGGEMMKTADGRTKPGQDLHWFRFDTDDTEAGKDFSTAYGNEPTTINVYLPYTTPDENFQAWKEEYTGGGLVHRCDGETMSVHLLPDGKYSTVAKPCPYHAGTMQRTAKSPGCKAVGRLMAIVPELRRFAYVTVLTTSVNDIMELTDNLNAIYAMRGTLQGVPLILCRRPRSISTPTPDGKRARYEKWMLSVEVNPAWAQMQLENMGRVAYLPADRLQLTDSGMVDGETGEIIDAEPQPATQGKATPVPAPQRQPQPVTEVTEPPNIFDDDSVGHNAISQTEPITESQLKALHGYGMKAYGSAAAWKAKRAELVSTITAGASKSSKFLSRSEADRLIDGLKKKIGGTLSDDELTQLAEIAGYAPEPEDLASVPEVVH